MKCEEAILGYDFIQRFKIDVLQTSPSIVINDNSLPNAVCSTIRTITIKPFTEKLLEVAVSNTAYVNRLSAFESFDQVNENLLFAKSIDVVQNNRVKVLAYNFSNKPVTLRARRDIGLLEAIDSNLIVNEDVFVNSAACNEAP
jgi:hypothetical protein